MKISICILNWNHKEILQRSLPIIKKQVKNISHEILVYDQNSEDGSDEYILQCDYIDTYFLSSINTGNSISRNHMITMAKGEYILLLDSDIIPIDGSVPRMIDFLECHRDYSGIGYDPFCLSTMDFNKCTPIEATITAEDTIDEYEFVLSQYGLFKKELLIRYPFPEFYPFNEPGWGAEDSIAGEAMFSNHYKIARVLNRVYWHKTHSSTNFLGESYLRQRAIRRIYYEYFRMLSPEQQYKALLKKTLPITTLDLRLYTIETSSNASFRESDNLGDNLFPWLLKRFFPFFRFSSKSNNVLFFGGSVFEHSKNLNFPPEDVIYYGCGLSSENEICIPRDCNSYIYPRGNITAEMLRKNGYTLQSIVGDPVLCLAMLPKKLYYPDAPILKIKDAFSSLSMANNSEDTIAVARTKLTLDVQKVCQVQSFLDRVGQYKKVISSQIHPFLMAIMQGIPANLIAKDLRAKDISSFFNMPLECDHQQANLIIDDILQHKIEHFLFTFIRLGMKYKVNAAHVSGCNATSLCDS